jgi:hypothetical protein
MITRRPNVLKESAGRSTRCVCRFCHALEWLQAVFGSVAGIIGQLDSYCKCLRQSHWVIGSKNHCNYSTHKVFSVFSSRCLAAAFNGGNSIPFGFWNCPLFQLPTPQTNKQTNKLHGPSPRANYTDRATAACRRSDCQLLRIKDATWSAWRIPTAVLSIF